MRRAHMNMSWSDSMSSSITLTGSRVNVPRQHGPSRLAHLSRAGAGAGTATRNNGASSGNGNNHTLQRLVRELQESRIEEESEEDLLEPLFADTEALDRHLYGQEQGQEQEQRQQRQVAPATTASLGESQSTSELRASSSRSKRLVRRLKDKMRRLAHLISYYLSLIGREYASSVVYYRPIQIRMY